MPESVSGSDARKMPFSGVSIPALKKMAHRTVMVAGVGAIGAMTMLFVKPELADQIKTISPFSAQAEAPQSAAANEVPPALTAAASAVEKIQPAVPATPQPAVAEKQIVATTEKSKVEQAPANHAGPVDALAIVTPAKKAPGAAAQPRDQAWVTEWLAKRYRVAGEAANMLVATTYSTAHEINFDPLLILAVIAIESGFNPLAESPMGAKGLMQVMASVHHDKFRPLGGLKAALNPTANIKVGATILRDYVRETGSLEGGLKRYVGAAAFDNDSGYGWKVLTLATKAPAKPAAPQAAPEDKQDAADNPAKVASRSRTHQENDADGVMSASL
jgi:soluble lytic murein transglycosylase-like protein